MTLKFNVFFKRISIITVVTVLLWCGGLIWFGVQIRSYDENNTTKTDAIVVLTGGRNRIHEAIELLNKGLAPRLFISGVPEDISMHDIEDVAAINAENEDTVELGRHATNTIENADEVAAWCVKNKITSIRLVTSNYHIPRSVAELSLYRFPMVIIKHPVYSEYVATKWWASWGTFRLIAMEYNKYLIVCLRNLFKGVK